MEAVLIIASIVGVIGIIIWAASLYEKKRSEALEYLATSMNFSFVRKTDDSLINTHEHFDLFEKGHSKRVSNIMIGDSGDMKITIADYKYTVGNGKNSSTYSQTIIIIQSAHLNLPHFALSPENFFHKIGGMFGYQDIDFTSHPVFSKKYLLRGKDEDLIRESFKDEVLDYYEKNNILCTEGNGDEFVYYKNSKRIPPKEIQAFLQDGIKLYGLLKIQSSGLH